MKLSRFPVYQDGSSAPDCTHVELNLGDMIKAANECVDTLRECGSNAAIYEPQTIKRIADTETRMSLIQEFSRSYRAYNKYFSRLDEHLVTRQYKSKRYQEYGRIDPILLASTRFGETDVFTRRVKQEFNPSVTVILDGRSVCGDDIGNRTRALTSFALVSALNELGVDVTLDLVVSASGIYPTRKQQLLRSKFLEAGISLAGFEENSKYAPIATNACDIHDGGGINGKGQVSNILMTLKISQSGMPSAANAIMSFDQRMSAFCIEVTENLINGCTNGYATTPTHKQLGYLYPQSDIIICVAHPGSKGTLETQNPVSNKPQHFLYLGVGSEKDIPAACNQFTAEVGKYFADK